MRMEICCTILMPVWRACQDFLLWHTAFKKGSSAGMPRALATTEKARAVVFRTYSSMLSMSGAHGCNHGGQAGSLHSSSLSSEWLGEATCHALKGESHPSKG